MPLKPLSTNVFPAPDWPTIVKICLIEKDTIEDVAESFTLAVNTRCRSGSREWNCQKPSPPIRFRELRWPRLRSLQLVVTPPIVVARRSVENKDIPSRPLPKAILAIFGQANGVADTIRLPVARRSLDQNTCQHIGGDYVAECGSDMPPIVLSCEPSMMIPAPLFPRLPKPVALVPIKLAVT